ncbi:MAG: TSUP family transporter [Terracidiphilus sp.]
MNWLILLVGAAVGVFSGVVGIGGGILFVPALVWIVGMDQHRAQGTSIGALLAPVGLFAFLEYYRNGNADIRVAALLALGFLVGSYFGAAWAQNIPDVLLRRIFAVTLVIVGARMFFSR